MTWCAWLFEAKSIQSYLFASGRLRDMVGGSELIESLTGELLDGVLRALDEKDSIDFSRRAGGAIYAFSLEEKPLERLRDLFTLAVQQYAPGLRFETGWGTGGSPLAAFGNARTDMTDAGSRLRPERPATPPVGERSRRTGGAAVEWDRKERGPVDAPTRARRRHADVARGGLVERIQPEGAAIGWHHWPLNVDPTQERTFPFRGEDRTVALLHADGNGFGQLLRNAQAAAEQEPDQFPKLFRRLSEAISRTTERAVRTAVREVLLPARDETTGMLPARPIVVGGDDLSFLVRADLALPFLQRFTAAFEAVSREALDELAEDGIGGDDVPDHLTVGAGCVFMRATQPFSMAHELAEDLTAHAKRAGKRTEPVTSTVAFHRVTASLVGDYDAVLERELSNTWGSATYHHTLGAYTIRPTQGHLPVLDDLVALQELLDDPAWTGGATRELLTLIGMDPQHAAMRYRRWRQVNAEGSQRHRLDWFDHYMKRLMPGFDPTAATLPFGAGPDDFRTPLGDAQVLKAVGNRRLAEDKAAAGGGTV